MCRLFSILMWQETNWLFMAVALLCFLLESSWNCYEVGFSPIFQLGIQRPKDLEWLTQDRKEKWWSSDSIPAAPASKGRAGPCPSSDFSDCHSSASDGYCLILLMALWPCPGPSPGLEMGAQGQHVAGSRPENKASNVRTSAGPFPLVVLISALQFHPLWSVLGGWPGTPAVSPTDSPAPDTSSGLTECV